MTVYGFENESIETQRPRSKLNIDAMSGVTTDLLMEVKRIGIFVNDRINDRTFVLGLRYEIPRLAPTKQDSRYPR